MSIQGLDEGRRKKWILVANRAEAKILEADWRIENLNLVRDIPFPDGRKQNHEIDADDQGSRFTFMAGQKHGLDPKEESTEHKANVFARELCQLLHEGRTHGEFEDLILVAEPHFLGRLRTFLDKETSNHVVTSVNSNWVNLKDADLRKKLRAVVRGAAA